MQQQFLVESRSYDQLVRGSWYTYQLDVHTQLEEKPHGEEETPTTAVYGSGCLRERRCTGPLALAHCAITVCNSSGLNAGIC